MQDNTIESVFEKYKSLLMSVSGVVGVAIGMYQGKPCIKVYAARRTPELLREIPATFEGFPVIIEETGEFRALTSQ